MGVSENGRNLPCFFGNLYDKPVDLGVNYSLLYPIQKEFNQQKWVLLHRNGDIMERNIMGCYQEYDLANGWIMGVPRDLTHLNIVI
jgi:hypothetical protein